ncbi:transposase, partial [Lactococcus lactis]|uniref:transposase n=1 Tax=Lactococcus lactis TaxID=1358 RepID=UPI0028923EB3
IGNPSLNHRYRKGFYSLFKTLQQNHFSNGKIEAKNTHIKTLKRVSYGFNSFTNMRIRIFLINGLIKIK